MVRKMLLQTIPLVDTQMGERYIRRFSLQIASPEYCDIYIRVHHSELPSHPGGWFASLFTGKLHHFSSDELFYRLMED